MLYSSLSAVYFLSLSSGLHPPHGSDLLTASVTSLLISPHSSGCLE
jgi:hypothetical protein